jgi:hypothetical protein
LGRGVGGEFLPSSSVRSIRVGNIKANSCMCRTAWDEDLAPDIEVEDQRSRERIKRQLEVEEEMEMRLELQRREKIKKAERNLGRER